MKLPLPLLVVILLVGIGHTAVAQTSTSPASPAPASTSVSPSAPSQPVADIIKQAQALVQAGSFDQAVALLTKQLNITTSSTDQVALQSSLADTQYAWGMHLIESADFAGALDRLSTAYSLDQKSRPREAGHDLRRIGIVYLDRGDYSKAMELFEGSLGYARSTSDLKGQGEALGNIGLVYTELGEYAKALDYDKQSLAQARQIGNEQDIEHKLNNIGLVYMYTGQYAQALDYDKQSLALATEIGDKQAAAHSLGNMGDVNIYTGQYAQALDYIKQSLKLATEINDIQNEEDNLGDIGIVYEYLGQYTQALNYDKQSLKLASEIGDKQTVEHSLENIGNVYTNLRQYAQALNFDKQSLELATKIGDKPTMAHELCAIGNSYEAYGQYGQALNYGKQSLALATEIGDKQTLEETLENIGNAYGDLRQYSDAVAYHQKALTKQREIGDRQSEAAALIDLMIDYEKQRDYSLAIFVGKQAVNTYQDIRTDVASLTRASQLSYLATVEPNYRILADLLISQGRLAEAQQVLALLKEQEFFDFIRPDEEEHGGLDMKLSPLTFTPREARWNKRLDNASAPLPSLGAQIATLENERQPSPADRVELASIRKKLQAAEAIFSRTLSATAADFSGPLTSEDYLAGTAQADALARALPSGTAVIDTIVSPDKLYLICIAPAMSNHPARTVARTVPITSKKLYAKVVDFRAALMNPNIDPRPLCREFYRLLITPLQRPLAQAHIHALLFSLDDALRYIPPAALMNPATNRYLVQDYQTALITLINPPTQQTAGGPQQVLGMGVSVSEHGLPALPGVQKELDAIVRAPGDNAGLLPGVRLLNDRFTSAVMDADLSAHHYPLVHVASHFLISDTDTDSYLILGDGTSMSVADLRQDPHRFAGVELLTLSACDTAEEVKVGDGHEIDGFAALMQQLGARSVLASLWPVSDTVTPDFMRTFYAYRTTHPLAPLSQCLRQAQLALIAGAPPVAVSDATRGFAPLKPANVGAPAYSYDPARPYAHPYYWAPFILMGNWR